MKTFIVKEQLKRLRETLGYDYQQMSEDIREHDRKRMAKFFSPDDSRFTKGLMFADVDAQTVEEWENGTRPFSIELARYFSWSYDLSIAWLILGIIDGKADHVNRGIKDYANTIATGDNVLPGTKNPDFKWDDPFIIEFPYTLRNRATSFQRANDFDLKQFYEAYASKGLNIIKARRYTFYSYDDCYDFKDAYDVAKIFDLRLEDAALGLYEFTAEIPNSVEIEDDPDRTIEVLEEHDTYRVVKFGKIAEDKRILNQDHAA